MTQQGRRARTALAGAAVGLLAACGSTVPTGATGPGVAPGDPQGLGTTGGASVTTGGVPGVLPDGTTGTGTGSTGGPATPGGGGASGDGATGTTSGGGSGTAVTLGRGVTAKTVTVGMVYAPNLNDAQRATGQDNLQTGDARRQMQALLDEINRTGGLAGRKVLLDAYPISATSPDAEQAFNAACQHFVRDTRVFAVMTPGPASYGACLERGGVLQIGSDLTAATEATSRQVPHALRPAGITLDDAARMLVSGLDAQGYFKGSKVGVITFDGDAYKSTVTRVLKPALAAIGHPAQDEFYVATPRGVQDYGTMSSSISSAVLRFRTNQITHVVMLDQQGRITTFFTPAAESQQYRPRYGFTSQAGFQVGLTGGGVSPRQAENAMGIGWLPAFDVPLSRSAMTPGGRRCVDFFARRQMAAAGENATVIQQFQCQDAWLLDTVMDRLTTEVTRDAFLRLALQIPVTSAANLAISFAPGRLDGVAAVRNVAWNASCGCFRYTSGNRRVS